MSDYLLKLNYFNFYENFLWEDMLVVFLLYNFFKYLIVSIVVELIWPTQMFNRKHLIGYDVLKYRTYTEYILKLRNFTPYYSVFNSYYLRYFFILKN